MATMTPNTHCKPIQLSLFMGEDTRPAEPKPRWMAVVERWRALPPEERMRIHLETVPGRVAGRAATAGGRGGEGALERHLRRFMACRGAG